MKRHGNLSTTEDSDISFIEIETARRKEEKKKQKKPFAAWKIAVIAIAALILAFCVFYVVSALNLHTAINNYTHHFENIVKAAVSGDYTDLETSAIAATAAAKTLDEQASDARWKVFDFIPDFKSDREKGAEIASRLRTLNDEVIWDTVYAIYTSRMPEALEEINALSPGEATSTCLTTYTGLLDGIYDTVMDFLVTFNSYPQFNISLLEKEVADFRYPANLAIKILPAVKDLSDNVLKPANALITENPLELPDELSLDTLDGELTGTLKKYTDFLSDSYQPLADCLDIIDSTINEVEPPVRTEKELKEAETDPGFTDHVIEACDKAKELLPSVITPLKQAKPVIFDLAVPAVDTLAECPPSELKQGDKLFSVRTINTYIKLLEELEPKFISISDTLLDIDVSNEKITSALEKVSNLLLKAEDAYQDAAEFLPLLKQVLIDDGDVHIFLFAAQNSAEIRASGGFPGSMGFIVIAGEDPVMEIKDFSSVWDTLPYEVPASANVRDGENALFGKWLKFPRDAVYDPDFPRVAEIWYESYFKKEGYWCDGVLSMTPGVVHKLMQVTGDITLSDGTVLTPENTARILEHDIYFKYFGEDAKGLSEHELDLRNQQADALFSEAASKIISTLFSNISLDALTQVLDIARECRDDRTIQLWFSDEEKQQISIDSGFSGSLNLYEDKPEVGIFYSCATSSKLGWFLDINSEIGEGVYNEDRDIYTYDVKASFTNTAPKDITKNSKYIVGTDGGDMRSFIHLFAPMGGNIKNVRGVSSSTGNTVGFNYTDYHDLECAYRLPYFLSPGETLTVTFQVTTAPGVKAVPKISQTPTLQNYR